MLIDCDTCAGQDVHCGDCVISMLLQSPVPAPRPTARRHPPIRSAPGAAAAVRGHGTRPTVDLDTDERIAFARLAEAGLVPPLRLVPSDERRQRGA